ncbi:MAG: alpha/beta hydrolase [Planctomycetota bacterium]
MLDDQAQTFLNLQRAAQRPGWESLGVERAREMFASLTDWFGDGTGSVDTEDFQVPVSDGHRIRCRLYRPATSRGDSPTGVVMFFHGGGFVLGDLNTHDTMCRRLASASGTAVVSVQYRCSPESPHPGPIDDCEAATRHVARTSDRWNIDASRMVVTGDSAGGYLAMAVAIRLRDRLPTDGAAIRPRLLMLIYPVVSPACDTPSHIAFADGHGLTRATMAWFWSQYLGDVQWRADEVDLLHQPLVGLPPTHIITAGYDVLRDEGLELVDAMRRSGISVTHQSYDGMLHGFIHFAGLFDRSRDATDAVGRRIRETLSSNFGTHS